nr:TlpA family protein disulfide reductase [Oscillospiraceae bacterium]
MNKIKELWNNKKARWGIIGGAAALLVVIAVVLVVLLAGGNKNTGAPITGCTVTVKTEGGMALEGVGVYVYADAEKQELISYGKTDKDGKAAIAAEVPTGSIAVLEGAPAGYVVEASYAITQADTQIVLKTELLKEMAPITVGGIMFDFTVTDTEGTTHTLSELLKSNKAVVLNLWYTNCGPCKAEFPYLQQAYDLYGENIALLGLNCYAEDDEAAVANFKASSGLTFPMAKCDAKWETLIQDMAYPTTIVIDRYGMVSLLHIGGIDDTGVFAGVFQHYAADDYVQSTVADITSLKVELAPSGEGTQDNPLEFAGLTEFEVTVEPGKTIYCNLYRVSGMELSVQSENVAILYGEQQFLPVEGVVTCLINTPDPMTPALVAFTNNGTAAETYKVTLTAPEGSQDNPFALELGDFTADIAEGNFQGVFYTYEASESGDFVLTVKKAPSVEYGIVLNNLTSGKYLSLTENGEKDEDGNMTLSVSVNRKDELQIIVTVDPDSEGKYPAAQVELNAAEVAKEDAPVDGTGGTTGGTTGGGSSSGGTTGDTGNYNGTLVNPDAPVEQYGFNDFEIEVGAGEKKLVYMIRTINTATLCLYDKDAYVVYNGKTYKPNSSGNIYISMESEGSFTPLELEIGNSGTSKKTFDVIFYFPEGSRENPVKLKLGENKVECEAGNDQGTFYTYKTSKAGTLTLEITNVDPSSVVVGISISDMQTVPTVVELEEGATSLSIELPAGAEAEITFSTKDPAKEWKIPAADITINATFA